MLSNFIKKLMFARQFYMNEGSIEIMKVKHIMLPSSVVHDISSPDDYARIKENTKKEFHELANNYGSGREGLLVSVEDIFDKYGLGRLEITDLDKKNKSADLTLYNSSIAHAHMEKDQASGTPACGLTSAILAGIFSYLLDEDVDCAETRCFGKGEEVCEFIVRKKGGEKPIGEVNEKP